MADGKQEDGFTSNVKSVNHSVIADPQPVPIASREVVMREQRQPLAHII